MRQPKKKGIFRGSSIHVHDAWLCKAGILIQTPPPPMKGRPTSKRVEDGICPNLYLDEDWAGSGLKTEENHLNIKIVDSSDLCDACIR